VFRSRDTCLYQMRKYSTSEVAMMLGIHRPNLQRAIKQGLPAPAPVKVGQLKVRLWTKADIERARKALKKDS
jgi:predicted DNA-binding transcriptional regulator AlpA